MNSICQDQTLNLTEEEAMGLLDIIMLSPMDLSPEQRAAAEKLSNYCKAKFREAAAAAKNGSKITGSPLYAA